MEDEREKSLDRGQEKYVHYPKKVFDGNQRIAQSDHGDYSESELSTSSTPIIGATAAGYDDSSGILMAGGVAAQMKRFGSPGKMSFNKQYVEYLINRITELEESLSNRDLIVNTLQRELELSKDMSMVDASAGPITPGLSSEVTTTTTKIADGSSQASRITTTKIEDELIFKLRQKDKEIEMLRRELESFSKNQTPSSGDFSLDNQRSRVAVLECQIKEQAITIDQLNLELVRRKKQSQKKVEEFLHERSVTSNEIKGLMRSVEELGREVQNKDVELRHTRDELSSVRAEMEENFGTHLTYIKDQLKICHSEEKDRLNVIHDDVMMRYMKVHETEIACYKKQVESLTNRVKELSKSNHELDTELTACRLAHEAQIGSYKECVESLVEELSTEKERNQVQHNAQLDKYKIDLENYRHQVASFEGVLGERVLAVEEKYKKQLDKHRADWEAQFLVYKSFAESLIQKEKSVEDDIASVNSHLKDTAVLESKFNDQCDAFKKQIEALQKEIGNLVSKLKEAENNECNVHEKYDLCVKDLDERNEQLGFLKEKLERKESNEEMLLAELKKYQKVIEDYETKIRESNTKFKEDLSQVETKHANVVDTFQQQIENLFYSLNEMKTQHDHEMNECLQQFVKQQRQIESLQDLAECSLDEVCEKIKEHKSCKDEINSLTLQLSTASGSIREYEAQLSQMQQYYEDNLSVYKKQIDDLREELNNAASLEERLATQLSNHVHGVKESKDHLKELLLQKDLHVYFAESIKGMDMHKFGDGSRVVDGDVHGDFHVRSELDIGDEDVRFDETDGLGKPKCNISIQPNSSSSSEKRLVERALLAELQKELEDCKSENSKKEKLLDDFMKSNEKLGEHCKSLEEEFNEMKSFATEKVEELESLLNEKESLMCAKKQLEEDQRFLISKVESLKEELTSRDVEVESLPEHFDYNDSENRQPLSCNVKRLFRNVATSTPNLIDEVNQQGDDDMLTPKRKIVETFSKTQNIVVKWINRCNGLEVENIELRREINALNVKLKEMEHCEDVVKSEITVFQEKCQDLENRLFALESEKKVVAELERENKQLKLKNEKLKEDRHILRSDVASLKEDTFTLQRKYEEVKAKLLQKSNDENQIGNEVFESLIIELNQKAEEVLIVKEEVAIKQEQINNLEDELERLMEIRVELKAKLDTLLGDLKKSEEELISLRQERMNIGLEKRVLEKKLIVVKAQNEQLMNDVGERVQSESSSNVVSVVEELEKELVDLHRKLAAERGVIERMTIEKSVIREGGGDSDEDKLSEKSTLLLNAFKQLENERECLKRKTHELQEIINEYLDGHEIDENWQSSVKESQQKLIMELEDYCKRDKHLEGTLVETGELKSRLEFMEKNLLQKSQEKCEVEQMLAEDRQELHNALNKVKFLEQQLFEKISLVQVLEPEKEQLQNNLWALEEKLCAMEEHVQQQKLVLEGEIQERELRVRHAQLELRACQLDNHTLANRLNYNSDHETEIEMVARMQKEVEKEHDLAITRLKRLYYNQMQNSMENAAAQMLALEQRHQNQVKALEEELIEQANVVREMKNKKIIDVLCSTDRDLKEMIANKEKQNEELEEIEKKLDANGLLVFSLLKSSFETYMQIHIAHAVSSLKKEHKHEMETTVTRLREEHKREVSLLESKANLEKMKEMTAAEKNYEKMYKDDINNLEWILNVETKKENCGKSRNSLILGRLLRTIGGDYRSKLKMLNEAWTSKYGDSLSRLREQLDDKCTHKKTEQEKVPSLESVQFSLSEKSNVEDLLTFKETLISCSEEFHSSMKNFYESSLLELESTLEKIHDEVVNVVDELKTQLEKGIIIASLEEKVKNLIKEKEQLEVKHKSAIELLSKDHANELSVVTTLLSEFQPCCTEHCNDPEALSKMQSELEARYEKQFKDLRIYYEQKLVETERNFSEGILSQHSRRLSACSSSSVSELTADVLGMQDSLLSGTAGSNNMPKLQEDNLPDPEVQTVNKAQIDYQDDRLFVAKAESIPSLKEFCLDNLSEDGTDFNSEFHDMVPRDNLKELENKYELIIQKLRVELQEQKDKSNRIVTSVREHMVNDNANEFEKKIKEIQEKEDNKLKAVVEEYENKLKRLKDDIENHEENKLASAANECENRLSALRKDLKAEEEKQIQRLIEEYEEKLKLLQETLTKRELESLKAFKAEFDSEMLKINEENKTVLDTNERLSKDLKQYEVKIEILRKQTEEYEVELCKYRTEEDGCKEIIKKNETIKNCENTIKNMGEKLKVLEEEKEQNNNLIKTFENQIINANNTVKNLEDEKNDLKKKLETLPAEYREQNKIQLKEMRLELEKKYTFLLEKLQERLETVSKSHAVEENVKRITDDVKLCYETEVERLRFKNDCHDDCAQKIEKVKNDMLRMFDKTLQEQALKYDEEKQRLVDNLNRQHEIDVGAIQGRYENRVKEEVENAKSQMKRQELDHVWKAQVEVEKRHRKLLSEMEQEWKEKLLEQQAEAISEFTLKKITAETTELKRIEENLREENKQKLEIFAKNIEREKDEQLDEQRKIMLKEFCSLEALLKKEMQDEKNGFLKEHEETVNCIIRKKNAEIEKINSQHKVEVQRLKQMYEEKIERLWSGNEVASKCSSLYDEEALVEQARSQVLCDLDQQIKVLLDEGDELSKSSWPPELATLERRFTANYQQQMATLVQEHDVEVHDLKTQFEAKIQLLAENCTCEAAKMIVNALSGETEVSEDGILHKVIKERDALRRMTLTLRGVVNELAKYLMTCEDELNNTLIGELVKLEGNSGDVVITEVTDSDTSCEGNTCSILQTPERTKRVHFAPDVSNIIDEDSLFDYLGKSHDLSLDVRNELESCMERLKSEAAAVLGLTALRSKDTTNRSVESRRLASVTRQLIQRNKEFEEIGNQLENAKDTITKYELELVEVKADLVAEKTQREKERAALTTTAETVYGDKETTAVEMETRLKLFQLQEKVRTMVGKLGPDSSSQIISMVDELCSEVDQLLDEARKDREDLQLQVDAADKQLRSTRKFLDDQAIERETERDEFVRDINQLREQVLEKGRDWMTREQFNSEQSEFGNGFCECDRKKVRMEVETLEQQVLESTNQLKETRLKKDEIENDLKDAIQKIWSLRELVKDLECQVMSKSEREAALERRLDELESELETQNKAQNAMALELEAMQDGSHREDDLRQLEEQFKKQCNPGILKQMRSQLREMARSVQKRTKDMESLNVHVSSASLSSPSEDISIREQLDLFRCGNETPEGCQSPVPLPVEEVNFLQEQLLRHTKIEELSVKRIRDQEMQLTSLRSRYEDVQVERDVLQEKCDQQLSQIAAAKTRLDDVRRRAEWAQAKTDAVSMERITNLEEELTGLQTALKQKEREASATKQEVSSLQRILEVKDSELSVYVESQNGQIELLRHELNIMEAEKRKLQLMLAKFKDGHSVSLPALMEEILADKNADIDNLEKKVKELQAIQNNSSFVEKRSDAERASHSNTKRHRVSFADEIDSSSMKDVERTRDAENILNTIPHFSPYFSSTVNKIEKSAELHLSSAPHSAVGFSGGSGKEGILAGGDYIPEWRKPTPPPDYVIVIEELKMEIEELKNQLESKTKDQYEYRERLTEMAGLERELTAVKDELALTVSEVADVKKFHREQLDTISGLQKKLAERENEIEELKDIISYKEENLVRVTADVKAMQLILDKLQMKVQEAKHSAASSEASKNQTAEIQDLKEENVQLSREVLVLKKELDKVPIAELSLLKQSLEDEKDASKYLRDELRSLEREKEHSISEVNNLKRSCESMKKELDNALSQLSKREEELFGLQKELLMRTKDNKGLNEKLYEMKQELDVMSRKATFELNNRIKKDSEDVIKMKDELEQLRSINYKLESDCDKLRTELINVDERIKVDAEMTRNETKIMELENIVKEMEREKENLIEEQTSLSRKYEAERERCETLISAAESYKNSETAAQERVLKEKEGRMNAEKRMQYVKREFEKLKRSKKELEKKNTVLVDELEKEKRHTLALEQGSVKVRKYLEGLSISPVDTLEIKPTAEKRVGGSLDDLAGELQRELDASAQLDESLISTLDCQQAGSTTSLPTEPLLSILHKVLQQGFQNLTVEENRTLHEETSLRLHSRYSPTIAELMNRMHTLTSAIQKQKQSIENLHEQVNSERLRYSKEKERVVVLEGEVERLQKIINYQEERLSTLAVTVEENRKYTSELEISVLKEKGNFKKLHVLLESERERVKQIQREDTELIEDLRLCLEEEKDSKVRLQMCLEHERERLQTLEAQLNAARAVEHYIESNGSSEMSHLKKCLEDLKDKYTELGVELEREKRRVGALSAALNKEKSECEQLRSVLYTKNTEHINLQAEVDDLKHQISEEKKKKGETEDKIKTIQEAEIRRQRSRATTEERHRKALDRAKSQKRELEAEVARLRRQLVDEKDEDNLLSRVQSDAVSVPLVNQIKDVNDELEKLVKEREHLTLTVAALSEKNQQLEAIISQTAEQKNNEREAQYFMSLYLRGKSHRKALIWQKRYLMLALQGYQEQDEKLAMKISSSMQNRSWVLGNANRGPSTASKRTFKQAAFAVIAITRMQTIVKTRRKILGLNYKVPSPKRERLYRQKFRSFSPRDSIGPPSFSPPIREIGSPNRNEASRNESPMKPTRLADYLETFNKLQSRLSQALSPPNRDYGLEPKIISKVLH